MDDARIKKLGDGNYWKGSWKRIRSRKSTLRKV